MTKLELHQAPWLREKPLQRVLAALGGEARIVGGAVRNALIGAEVKDVDIATPLTPDEVTQRLTAAGIKPVPTGIEHGTITAVADGKPYEVTTLRRDVETDGRRAVVAFTTDWREDAARRDFTMNALYAAADGEIFDYHNGIADLTAGRVRFIGDATARIREDYLRILRLFRFHAWYGKGEIDPTALKAAASEKAGIAKLSGERIQQEILRLLEAENPAPMLRVMAASGILSEIFPGKVDVTRMERIAAIDAANFFTPDPVLRLAALLGNDEKTVAAVAERFKLSNKDRARLEDLAGGQEKIVSYLSIREVRKLLYRLDSGRFRDRAFLRWADDPKTSNAIQWRALLELANTWQRPVFPLTGRDVMQAGVPEGPLVGQILSEVEDWWIDADFTDDEFSLAERLKAVVQATAY
ncbi:MAG TPA: CCA tRNA nucleotidyltransferase [Rhizomicrobium sp.]|nr:CCA tRNA nucleotidyltransferase [Rhizomicrobium sp.]